MVTIDSTLNFLIAFVWLGGANYVLIKSIKRQNLPWYYYFMPYFVLKGKDWLEILLLVAISFALWDLKEKFSG